ncbi:hypothetical protein BC830DRAFT_399660 [Chytriomyces sp. MP71]|nr:hypothetical protein BC830DRAFT_399660 [Chytriomyces sp. MP71]
MTVVCKAVRSFEGCIRQFNCDDKALTALLVWGLEGMSHEKGEMGLALSAAFEIAQSFPPILNNEFAIGVTSGTAFSGVVGTKTRCDATILGVAVNNAARLMSLEICHGSVLCDHETFKHTDEMFEFDVNIPLVGLKGVERPVKIYRPTQRQNLNMLNERKSLRRELFGREKEIRELELILSNWRAHWMEQRVINCLIVGQSGIGKSEILVWLHHAIDAKTEILCIARAQEHKQESVLFSWTQIFYSFLMQLAKNPCFLTALKSTPSETHPSLKRGRRGTIFTDVSKPSNAVNEGGEPRSDTDEKAKLKTVLISLLQSLNFPFSYIEHLNYLCGLSNSSSFSNGVSSLQLGVIVSRIFNAIHDSGVNVAISLDDIQWCDPASLELAQVLLAKCPNVLFSFAARPVEEWRPELAKYFTYISTAPLFKTMRLNALSALNIDAMLRKAIKLPVKLIDQSLITGILIRSQGVPMVAQLLIYSLAEDHRETIAAGLPVSLITTAMNATTAVVAQFDKLSPKLKSLLRVAAVSGQVFKLEDVGAVLELLETSKSVSPTVKKNSFKHSNDALLSLIINYDKFQFITAKETHGDLSFAHYLIQQGILSTIVPKEREQLHRLFFEYYEYLLEVFSTHTLETSEFTSIRQTMIHHLLSFPSESRKKKQIIYDAFIEAAEMNQTNLSFNYLSILEQLPAQVDLTDTIYKKIRECRLLTQLHFEQGQYKAAISFVSRGLRFMGCQQKYGSSNPLTIMPTVLSMCKQIKTMILLGDTERRKFAVKHIKKVFPRILESKNAEFSSDEVQETLKQLAQLLYLGASSYEHSRPGLELLQLTLMAAYPICLITTDRPHRLCWYFSSLSIATGTLGFSELSRLCKDLSDTVSNQAGLNTEEVLDIMSSFQIGLIVVLKEMTSYTLVLEGKFEESARTLKEGIDLLADEGLQLSEKANYLTAFAWSSTLNALMRQHEYYSFFEREEHSYQSAGLGKYALCEIHMTAASTLCAMNLVSRAKEIYLQHVQMTRSSPSEFLESNRRIHILTNALRVCVAVIRVSNGRETLDMEGHLVLCFHTFSSNLLRMFNIRACLTYLPLFIELGLHNIQQKILCEDTFTAIGVKGSKCVSLVRKILRFIQTEIIFPHYPGITYKKKLAGAAAILWASGTSLSNLKKTLEGFVKCCRALLKNLYSKGTEFDPPAAHKCLIRTRIWYAEGLLLLVMRVGGRTVVAGSSKELKWREQGQQLKRDLETSSWTVDWELYLIECAFQKCVSCV